MRRTVATLLVVASPLLMAVPVGAEDGRRAGPASPAALEAPGVPSPAGPAAPGVPSPAGPAAPAAAHPEDVLSTPPAAPASPVALTPPAVAAPALPAAAVTKAVKPRAAVRPSGTVVPAKAPGRALSDAAYAERLQAELCMARQIFCGLDHNGRYRAG